jgi:hypothetical protein
MIHKGDSLIRSRRIAAMQPVFSNAFSKAVENRIKPSDQGVRRWPGRHSRSCRKARSAWRGWRCPSSEFLGQERLKIREFLARLICNTVQQAAIGDGLSFDPFSFDQNGLAAAEVDVGRRQVADAL